MYCSLTTLRLIKVVIKTNMTYSLFYINSIYSYDCQIPVLFPKEETINAYSEHIESASPDFTERLGRDYEQLRATAGKDPMYEMHEQEKKAIWASRYSIRRHIVNVQLLLLANFATLSWKFSLFLEHFSLVIGFCKSLRII